MGASASILEGMPKEPMDEAAARSFLKDRYSEEKFAELKDDRTGTVSPDSVRHLIESSSLSSSSSGRRSDPDGHAMPRFASHGSVQAYSTQDVLDLFERSNAGEDTGTAMSRKEILELVVVSSIVDPSVNQPIFVPRLSFVLSNEQSHLRAHNLDACLIFFL